LSGIWLVSLRDLAWRKRRFAVGVVVTGVVFGLTLLLAGISASFGNEATRSVNAFHSDGWVVPAGDAGPFMSSATLPSGQAAVVAGLPGVHAAAPIAILRASLGYHGTKEINLIGVPSGSFAMPVIVSGRLPDRGGEAVVNRSIHAPLGAEISIAGLPFHVVGRTTGLTYRANVPSVYVLLQDAQGAAYGGQPLAAAIAVQGLPTTLPPGRVLLTNAAVRSDMLGPLRNPIKLINSVEAMLWVIAALIIGSIVYLSTLDRTRDFAVFKATGSATSRLLGYLAVQASVLAGSAYVLGLAVSALLTPRAAMPSEVPAGAYLTLLGVAAFVAVAASLTGLRRSARVDPALAFGSA
jgi:putative ABC transport system permease protein